MKKVGIITIIDNTNCGNRLQNYALQEVLKSMNFKVETLKNDPLLNNEYEYLINCLKYINQSFRNLFNKRKRYLFIKFNRYINFSKNIITCKTKNISNNYDYFIVGSDQVWKPTRRRLSYIDLLEFAPKNKRIAFATSFGIDNIDSKYLDRLKRALPLFKNISVREDKGKEIINNILPDINVEVLLDPTLLISKDKWNNLENNPFKEEKKDYVLGYFLGCENLDKINLYCKSNNFEFINFYEVGKYYGPSEFLYLIHNANIILTDSFHGCVFSIIYNRNFYVFNRIESDINNNMNSRLDTLLNTFNLKSRLVSSIDNINLLDNINYNSVNKVLEEKKKDSIDYLKKSLDIY